MIDPRINFRNRDLMARHALQKLRVRAADTIFGFGNPSANSPLRSLKNRSSSSRCCFLCTKLIKIPPFRHGRGRSSTWFHHDHHVLQLSRGPAATTEVFSQSREAPPIAEFNLEFGEIEASRNFLNRISVFNVVPNPPRPRIQKLQRLLDLQFVFQPFDRFPVLNSAKVLKLFNRLRL
jgi:hypothetical protein